MRSGSSRVVVVTTSYPRWPSDLAGSFVASSVRALRDAGAHVTVVAPDHPQAAPQPDIVRVRYAWPRGRQRLAYGAGIPERLEGGPGGWLQAPALSLSLLATLEREARRADVVVSHWLLPGAVAGALAAGAARRPHRTILHSGGVALASRLPGGALLSRLVARTADRLVITSARLRGRLCRLVGPRLARRVRARSVLQPMGVDLSALGPLPPRSAARRQHGVAGRFTVAFLGRVVPVKGLAHLVRAVAGIPDAVVLAAGDGPSLPAARAQAAALGVDLRCLGTVEGTRRAAFLAASDVLALPSVVLPSGRTEGTPVAMLEALAVGLPVVASDVGGVPDVIEEGRTGFVVPPGAESVLGERLARLAARPSLRRRMARAALEAGAAYSWESVGPRLASLLLEGTPCVR